MTEKEIQEIIRNNRRFMQHIEYEDGPESDQRKRLPQPPLYKSADEENFLIDLPKQFSELAIKQDFLSIIEGRKSDRVYKDAPLSLLQLSYLLWVTQGVKEIRGNHYATIRNVPCGGARHEFETYLMIQHIEGVEPGLYHYCADVHALELLKAEKNSKPVIDDMLSHQGWAQKASVVFLWSIVPYRAEWRYSIWAHRIALIDIGHVGENLYLGCQSIGLGTCGIGAFNQDYCDQYCAFDTEEEFTVYTATVGVL